MMVMVSVFAPAAMLITSALLMPPLDLLMELNVLPAQVTAVPALEKSTLETMPSVLHAKLIWANSSALMLVSPVELAAKTVMLMVPALSVMRTTDLTLDHALPAQLSARPAPLMPHLVLQPALSAIQPMATNSPPVLHVTHVESPTVPPAPAHQALAP